MSELCHILPKTLVSHSPIALAPPASPFPLADLLIFACAAIHGLEVAHDDSHFDEFTKLEA